MARSHAIYLIVDISANELNSIRACFTVKHEAIRYLYNQLDNGKDYEIWRTGDGTRAEFKKVDINK